ncbi:MAG: hypothetical protein GY746_17285 [Gammaproteobacteria bacterium]|nr:hypothetical protein [Gammaproteobacteria bacterium]
MTSNVQNTGTQILFADHATDFGAAPATAANTLVVGTPTDVQIDTTSLGASGGARQSAKVDLGTPRPSLYKVSACLEHAATPTDGDTVSFYWAASANSTAATGNVGSVTGSDAAYTETDGSLAQLQYIGSMTLQAGTINIGHIGFLMPSQRYGSLVMENNDSTAFGAAADETHIVFDPVVYGDA